MTKVTVSQALARLSAAGRALFEGWMTLCVWVCLFCGVLLLRDPRPFASPDGVECGQLVMSFLVFLAILCFIALLVLLHDFVQLRRGRLSQLAKWLRTAPATVAVLIVPAGLLYHLVL
jgi:hypothetical protein